MELKSLFSGNKGIALATTVIIAVCLLFSYIYLQDGEDGITVREDVVIGDSITWVQTNEDTGTVVLKKTLESILDDGYGVFSVYADGMISKTYVGSPDSLRGDITADPGMTESIGKDIVTLDGVQYECDIYLNDDGDKCYVSENGMILRQDFAGSGDSVYLKSSTLFKDSPDLLSAVRSDIRVGDFIGVESLNLFNSQSIYVLYIVESVSAGSYDVRVIVYDDTYDGGRYEYMAVIDTDEFIEMVYGVKDVPEGAVPHSQSICYTDMGDVLCDGYYVDGVNYLVGHDDGVIYYASDDHHAIHTIGLSLIYDDVEYDTSGLKPVETGDVVVYTRTLLDRVGTGYDPVSSYAYHRMAVAVEDGEVSFLRTEIPTMKSGVYSKDESGFARAYGEKFYSHIIGFDIVDTVMGKKLCFITRDTDSDTTTYMRCGVFDDVDYLRAYITSKDIELVYVSYSDLVESSFDGIKSGYFAWYDFSEGDLFYDRLELYFCIDGRIESVVSYDDGLIFMAPLKSKENYGAELVGSDTISTVFGDLDCDVYEFEYMGRSMRVWFNDGFPIQVQLYMLKDGVVTAEVHLLADSNHVDALRR